MENKNPNLGNEGFQSIMSELEGLRDDLRVRIHLAGMELKKRWDDIDRRYLSLYDNAKASTADVRDKARRGLLEIRNELQDLRDRVDYAKASKS